MAAARSVGDKKSQDKTWYLRNADRSTKTMSRMSALVSCYNAHGQQMFIPNTTMGDSFTGMQDLLRECIRLGRAAMDPEAVRMTLMQAGPSSFDFQFDMGEARGLKTWGKHPSGWDMTTYVALDQALATFAAAGQLGMLIAANPGCELRQVETQYGPDVEVVVDGSPRLVAELHLVQLVANVSVQCALRTAMAPLTNPEFTYVTIRGEVQGAMGMFNQVMVTNEHVREFIAGAPLSPRSFDVTLACPSSDEVSWTEARG